MEPEDAVLYGRLRVLLLRQPHCSATLPDVAEAVTSVGRRRGEGLRKVRGPETLGKAQGLGEVLVQGPRTGWEEGLGLHLSPRIAQRYARRRRRSPVATFLPLGCSGVPPRFTALYGAFARRSGGLSASVSFLWSLLLGRVVCLPPGVLCSCLSCMDVCSLLCSPALAIFCYFFYLI